MQHGSCRALVVGHNALPGESLARLLEHLGGMPAAFAELPLSVDQLVAGGAELGLVVVVDASGADERDASSVKRALRRAAPDAALVVLDGEDPTGAGGLAAAVGAVGVLSVHADVDVFLSAVAAAGAGDALPPTPGAPRRTVEPDDPVVRVLTERELQVLGRLADGEPVDRIAVALSISKHTVRTHIQNAMNKLGAGSRLEAIALVRRAGHQASAPAGGRARVGRPRRQRDAAATSVLVVAEAEVFRRGLEVGIEEDGDLEVVAEAASLREALGCLEREHSDVAVVDESVRGGAVAVCAAIKASGALTRVLVTSRAPDRTVLLAAVEAGADGYLTRGAGLVQLRDAVRRLGRGEAYIPPRMLGVLLRDLIERRREEDAALDRLASLSKRERTVLGLLVDGLDQEEMARQLFVSPHTARTHVQNVLRKLGVHSRLEAVSLVTRHNLHERFHLQRSTG